MKKADDCLDINFVIVLAKRNKSKYERMLHFDFIDEDIFASSVDVWIKQERTRNRTKEEHIQKNEYDEKSLEPFWNWKCHHLIVWKCVITSCYVGNEDHVPQVIIVWSELINDCLLWNLNYYASNQGKSNNNQKIEDHKDQKLFIGW